MKSLILIFAIFVKYSASQTTTTTSATTTRAGSTTTAQSGSTTEPPNWMRWPNDTYQPGVCICVPKGMCIYANGQTFSDGRGGLDTRISNTGGLPSLFHGNNLENLCQPVSVGVKITAEHQISCTSADLEICCPVPGYTCGVQYPPVESAIDPVSGSNQAYFGQFPWYAVIYNTTTRNPGFISSGVLITQSHVLTVAHRMVRAPQRVTVRLNEYDMSKPTQPLPKLDITATWVLHPQFNERNLCNNLAMVYLDTPAPLGKFPTITNICMPNTTLSDMRCFIAGYGQDFFQGGTMQRVLKTIDVPLVDPDQCELDLKKNTSLGMYFGLNRTCFNCAGGEAGKDACTGDGGAPLVCYVYDRWYLYGLAAWGMGCGLAGVPGVYVNVQSYIPWIQQAVNIPLSARVSTTTVRTTTRTTRASNTTTTAALGSTPSTTRAGNATTVASTTAAPSNATTTRAANGTTVVSTTAAGTSTTLASNTTTSTTRAGNTTAAASSSTITTTVVTTPGQLTSTTTRPANATTSTSASTTLASNTTSTTRAASTTSNVATTTLASNVTVTSTTVNSNATTTRTTVRAAPRMSATPDPNGTRSMVRSTTTTTRARRSSTKKTTTSAGQ